MVEEKRNFKRLFYLAKLRKEVVPWHCSSTHYSIVSTIEFPQALGTASGR